MGTEIASRNYTPEMGSSSGGGGSGVGVGVGVGGGGGGGDGDGSASIPLATPATPAGTPPVSLDIWTDTEQQQINGNFQSRVSLVS